MPTKQHSLFYITLIELVLIVSAVSVFHVFLMAIFSYQAAQPWPDEGPVSIAELRLRPIYSSILCLAVSGLSTFGTS